MRQYSLTISALYAVSANNAVIMVPRKKTPNIQTYSAKATLKEMCVGRSKPYTALPRSFAVHVIARLLIKTML